MSHCVPLLTPPCHVLRNTNDIVYTLVYSLSACIEANPWSLANNINACVYAFIICMHCQTCSACLRLSFMRLIQAELDLVAREWNTHHIRKQRNVSTYGIPDKLYFMPTLTGILIIVNSALVVVITSKPCRRC